MKVFVDIEECKMFLNKNHTNMTVSRIRVVKKSSS